VNWSFAADVSSKVVYVVRLVDGQLLEKRDRPKSECCFTAGRNVARYESHGNRYLLSVTDV